MTKTNEPDKDQIKELLIQINQKIGSAKVLNGGFDRLESEMSEMRIMQEKLNVDFESHKVNDARIEEKLDRLYDPEDGIYSKIHKSEGMIFVLTEKVNSLNSFDEKIQGRISEIDKKSSATEQKVTNIEKIAGKDNKDLHTAVKVGKGAWWIGGLAITGILSMIGKFLWDLFVG